MDRLEVINNELKSLREQSGIDPVFSWAGEYDIAYPSSVEEYSALRGCAVVMIVAISDNQEELPIKWAYFMNSKKEKILLRNLNVVIDDVVVLADEVKEIKDDKGKVYFENTSLWAIPLFFFRDDGGLIAFDFKEERKEFVILRGPWKVDSRIREWMINHVSTQITVAGGFSDDVFGRFIQREFINNNRVQL